MDFSIWIQSPYDWGILFLSALFVGISKTGIQGLSLLAVPMMAVTFGAKPSTGLILPILCLADLMAVWYYRRIAEWQYVLKLLPSALVGFAVALFCRQTGSSYRIQAFNGKLPFGSAACHVLVGLER